MSLEIKNLNWKYNKFQNFTGLLNALALSLKPLKIKVKLSVIEGGIGFHDITEGKTFISESDNKTAMKPTDPRVKQMGRNYLLTNRATKEQYEGFFNTIQKTLDDLGLSADVSLKVKGVNTVLRTGYNKFLAPRQKSFPVTKETK